MIIHIDVHTENGQFCASCSWGQSTWHRDPITAVSELFGRALPYAALYNGRPAYDTKSEKAASAAAPRANQSSPSPSGEPEGTPDPKLGAGMYGQK